MKFKSQEKESKDRDQIMDIENDSNYTGYNNSNYIDQDDNYYNTPMPYGMMPYGIVPGMPGMISGMMPAGPAQYCPLVDNGGIYNDSYCDSDEDNECTDMNNMSRSRRRHRRRRRYDYPYYYPGGFPFWLWWFL
ncbi:hypothetical protein ACSVC9_04275 [Clostridium sp. LBM24168]